MKNLPGELVTTKPRRTRNDPHAPEIGPRQVGGTYYDAYWGVTYEVVELDRRRDGWPAWEVAEKVLGDPNPGANVGRVRRHCTGWDYRRDRVVAEPPATTS